MKTTNRILILLVALTFMACEEKKVPEFNRSELPVTIYSNNIHVITLYVNTTDIQNPNIGDYANFGQPSGISNEDYTTHVKKGDIVIWRGVSITNPLDIVNINFINHQGGPKLFGKNLLQGNGGDNAIVAGVITEGPEEEKEKYMLKFTVKRDGEPQVNPFQIDPYIKANQ